MASVNETLIKKKDEYCHPIAEWQKDKRIKTAGAGLGDNGSNNIRNLAIIAHVDHGKTTLADTLIHKAGLLHKDRVGDQDKGRSLDTLKDEKDRGITIKSAAITLNFNVRANLLQERSSKTDTVGTKETHEGDGVDIYIGCLPHGYSQDQLLEWLAGRGVPFNGDSFVRSFSCRRSYAVVHAAGSGQVSKLLALDGQMLLEEGEEENRQHARKDRVMVELLGLSPMNRLKAACDARGIDMPRIEVVDAQGKRSSDGQDGNVTYYNGRAVWPALGGVMIQAAETRNTRKWARRAVAKQCLSFLSNQANDQANQKDSKETATPSIADVEDKQGHVDDGRAPMMINLIDSPGHIEFNAEVTSALRVSDGALVVVDAVEGKAIQTEQVLIQALKEGVKPVLMLNKVDRLFIDKQYSAEDVYDNMLRVVDDVNQFIGIHQLSTLPDQQVSFENGSVCFGSGYFGWGCSIDTFLKKDLTDDERSKMRKLLAKRDNFVQRIIRPILKMHRMCGVLPFKKVQNEQANRIEMINNFLSSAGHRGKLLVASDPDPSVMDPRKLLKKAMMVWLPAADCLVDMIAVHVPSPAVAQLYRAPMLYDGDIGDASGQGIYNCDADGPAIVYISKMSPSPEKGRKGLLAFGRVFSGTIQPGDSLRALRTDGTETVAKISQIKVCGVGGRMYRIQSAKAGQLVVLEGIDGSLDKAGTLTNAPDGFAVRHMDFAVVAVVQHSVTPKDKRNMTKMVSGLQQIVKADSTALFYKDKETDEFILSGAGGLHIEVLVSTLMQNTGIKIELSDPIIAYRETVQFSSSQVALAKSDNKHNRVWIKASPIPEAIVEAMEAGQQNRYDLKNLLSGDFGWSNSEVSRVWAIGPEPLHSGGGGGTTDRPTCILVDSTFGLQIPDDVRSNIAAAFMQVTRQGVLVNAPMRGVRFDLVDAKFHQDSVHRRPNSIVPAASRAMLGSFLLAGPCLAEPIFKVEVTGAVGSLNNAFSIIGKRGGTVVDMASTATTEKIEASVPVRQAFGLAEELRLATHGHSSATSSFSGMRLVPESELDGIVADARARRRLGDRVPQPETFIDRL